MNLLPQPSGARPRVACEITSQGIVAARADSATAAMSATARAPLASGAVQPGLRPGNLVDRLAVVTGLRRVLEDLGVRQNSRNVSLTLVVPDAAVRVLLLEFEALPTKLTEALPLMRFRLKKLVPFDADTAMVSYQVMHATRSLVRTLVVAMPRDVLSEYESAVREAGFEPGAVLPSTLASLAGLADGLATLVINASSAGITAAIADDQRLLLHRSVDLQAHSGGVPVNLPPALFESSAFTPSSLPLVDVDATGAEWAAQQPLPEHGRNPYTDRGGDETAVQNEDGITSLPVPPVMAQPLSPESLPGDLFVGGHADVAPVAHSPYMANTVLAELDAEKHNSILLAPVTLDVYVPPSPHAVIADAEAAPFRSAATALTPSEHDREISEAVSVAAAYFEDTLGRPPERVLSVGPLGADALAALLRRTGVGPEDGLEVREAVSSDQLLAGTSVPRGWLAGVAGALRG